ncbi:hypothetical protein Hanom_Chr07g00601451 [Helianthus anomalus]
MESLDLIEEFILGNMFDFENGIDGENYLNEGLRDAVNKRKKKSMLGSVNRPNPAYSSSLEKNEGRQEAQVQR